MQRIFEWRKINKYNSPWAEGLKRALAAFTTLNRRVDETGGDIKERGQYKVHPVQNTGWKVTSVYGGCTTGNNSDLNAED